MDRPDYLTRRNCSRKNSPFLLGCRIIVFGVTCACSNKRNTPAVWPLNYFFRFNLKELVTRSSAAKNGLCSRSAYNEKFCSSRFPSGERRMDKATATPPFGSEHAVRSTLIRAEFAALLIWSRDGAAATGQINSRRSIEGHEKNQNKTKFFFFFLTGSHLVIFRDNRGNFNGGLTGRHRRRSPLREPSAPILLLSVCSRNVTSTL